MPKVRTVFQPKTVIDVPEAEYRVLLASGLLAPDPAPAPETTTVPPTAEQPSTADAETTDAPATAADTSKKKG